MRANQEVIHTVAGHVAGDQASADTASMDEAVDVGIRGACGQSAAQIERATGRQVGRQPPLMM